MDEDQAQSGIPIIGHSILHCIPGISHLEMDRHRLACGNSCLVHAPNGSFQCELAERSIASSTMAHKGAKLGCFVVSDSFCGDGLVEEDQESLAIDRSGLPSVHHHSDGHGRLWKCHDP